jgi:heme/copper-type cytochrome/quinol oxidase subunit 3
VEGKTMAGDPGNTLLEQWHEADGEAGTLTQGPPPFFPAPPGDDGDGDRPDDDRRPDPPLSNAWLGMLMFLGAETMFFAGLIGSFLVFRVGNQTWPPLALPSLPVGITGANTLILLCSAITMWCAQRAIRAGQHQRGLRFLGSTALLGVAFLAIQGYEWIQLIGFGLTMASGVYGATFYILIGCHGLHVFGAVVWLLSVLVRTLAGRYSTTRSMGLALCGMYWYYVVALWPVLYWLVYLY